MPQFLVGAWSLVECAEILPDGSKRLPLGERPLGQVVYSADGHMAAQLVRAGRPAFPSDDYLSAPDDVAAEAFRQYFGYFGRYTVDLAAGTVTHLIEGAWLPNLENTTQVRTFRVDGDRLVLEAPTPWGVIRNSWTRAPQNPIA
jgi:hypothetical protein